MIKLQTKIVPSISYLTEQIIIKPKNHNYKALQELCFKTKSLFNVCLYERRQFEITKYKQNIKVSFIPENLYMKIISSNETYKALPSHCAQQTVKQVFLAYKSFFNAMKEFKTNPSKFKARPKPPRYKEKYSVTYFTYQQAKLKNNRLKFPTKTNLKPIKVRKCISSIKQVRIIPNNTCFIVEIVYKIPAIEPKPYNNKFLAMDLGIDNLITTIDNIKGSFIINGKILKSINQFYNKNMAKLSSMAKLGHKLYSTKQIRNITTKRNNKVKDSMHKISKFIVNYCEDNDITKIIIGHNKNQKQKINLGKQTNQNFVNLPIYKLIDMISYKSYLKGISVVITEESYTSKCDHLANETIEYHNEYLGKRKFRGLFISSTKQALNADVNGAIGIGRKVIDESVKQIIDSGVVLTPIKKLVA